MLFRSLKTIGAGAFQACSNLMVVTIPVHVEEIGVGAFGACDHLRELTLLNPDIKLTYAAYEDASILETAEDPTDFKNPVVTIKGYESSTAQELADHMNSKPYYQGKTNFKFVVLGGTGDTLATKQICKLLQNVKVTGSLTIKRGKSKTIKVTLPKGLKQVTKFSGKNKKGQMKISYKAISGDKTAVVNSKGKVTAKRKGVTVITVTITAHDGKEVSVKTMRVRVKVQ